jgi:hypothetical protein
MHADDKGMIEQQIATWIRKQVVVKNEVHGPCNKIILRHLNIEKKNQGDVGSFPIRLDPESEEIDPIINAIIESAQKDADDMNQGVQNYAIYAYFPQDASYVPRKIFRVAAANEEFERDVNPSEPPTEKGLVSQLMRHNERIHHPDAQAGEPAPHRDGGKILPAAGRFHDRHAGHR